MAVSHVKFYGARLPHTVLALNAGDIRDLLDVQKSGNAGQQALAEGSVTSNDVGKFALLDVLDQKRSIVFGETLYSGKMISSAI